MVNCWVYGRHIALVDGVINQLMTGGASGKTKSRAGYEIHCLCISIKKQLNNFADFYAFRNTTEVFQSSGVRLN